MTDLGGNIQFPDKYTNNFNDYNVSNSVTIANPQLQALANNGGFAPTMALLASSPAVNFGAGCATSPSTDQRGASRNGVCDSGSYEYNGVLEASSFLAESKSLLVYPNPSKDGLFYIELPSQINSENIKIQIYTIEGKLVFEGDYVDKKISFNLFQKGFFILKTTTDTASFTNKIFFE